MLQELGLAKMIQSTRSTDPVCTQCLYTLAFLIRLLLGPITDSAEPTVMIARVTPAVADSNITDDKDLARQYICIKARLQEETSCA